MSKFTASKSVRGMTPLLQGAFDVASYSGPVAPSELTVRLGYIGTGGVLSLLLVAVGCFFIYTHKTFSQDQQILLTSSLLLGCLGFCIAVAGAAIVLCRAYRGLYARNIDRMAREMEEVEDAVQLAKAIDALKYDPGFSVVFKGVSAVQVVQWMQKRIEEKQPALARFFHNAA